MVIRARRLGPMQYAAWDRLPLLLASGGEDGSLSGAEVVEVAKLMRELLVFCCLSPRLVEDPKQENEIAPRDIPEEDWTYIIRWAMRTEEAAKLRPFRIERKNGGHHSDGERVLLQTVGATGDRGSGAGPGGVPEGAGDAD